MIARALVKLLAAGERALLSARRLIGHRVASPNRRQLRELAARFGIDRRYLPGSPRARGESLKALGASEGRGQIALGAGDSLDLLEDGVVAHTITCTAATVERFSPQAEILAAALRSAAAAVRRALEIASELAAARCRKMIEELRRLLRLGVLNCLAEFLPTCHPVATTHGFGGTGALPSTRPPLARHHAQHAPPAQFVQPVTQIERTLIAVSARGLKS